LVLDTSVVSPEIVFAADRDFVLNEDESLWTARRRHSSYHSEPERAKDERSVLFAAANCIRRKGRRGGPVLFRFAKATSAS